MSIPCPRCGGQDSRLLAPGYFECTSVVTVDMVPPGPNNLGPRPVFGPCGNRYQNGDTQTPRCVCGMFAVGICTECGEPACGTHGSLIGQRFVCGDCIHVMRETAGREASAAARQAVIEAKAAVNEHRRELDELLPEVAGDSATAADLLAVVLRLLPDQMDVERTYVGRSWGFSKFVDCWTFEVGTGEPYSRNGSLGQAWSFSRVRVLANSTMEFAGRRELGELDQVDGTLLLLLKQQILKRADIKVESVPKLDQWYLVAFGDGIGPSRMFWHPKFMSR